MKNFKWTESSLRLLKIIKTKIIENFNNKNPVKISMKTTKKKEFLAVPIPYKSPAFQLYINNKFYTSYFLKDDKWIEIR
jgi:hypothetical protein